MTNDLDQLAEVNYSRRKTLKVMAAALATGSLLPFTTGSSFASTQEETNTQSNSDFRIKKAEAIPVRIPFTHAVKMAKGSFKHSRQVMVRLEDEQGRVGWGEAVNYPVIYGHGQKQIYNLLNDYLLPAMIGLDPLSMAQLHRAMDKALPFNNFSKTGIDNAAYDLAGKQRNVSVKQLLGGGEKSHMPLSAFIGIVPPEMAEEKARNAALKGYDAIKVKAGIDWKEDVARIIAVRKGAGDDMKIRVDANANYDRHTALKVLTAVEEVGLEYFEQPCKAEDIEGAAWLAAKVSTPIAADESVHGLESVFHVLSANAVSVVNVKFVRTGGLYPAVQVAALCESLGVKTFLGGAAELGMGMAAMTHFYCATTGIFEGGEALPSLYEDDLLGESIVARAVKGIPSIPLPTDSGMGVFVDPAKLAKYRLDY